MLVHDDFGIDTDASTTISVEEADAAFLEAVRAKNRSSWLIGDLYASGCLSDQVLDPAIISLKTVQNYAAVCARYPKRLRLVPLSQSHYEAAAKLAEQRMDEALSLLRAAYDGSLTRDWVREEADKLLGVYAETAEVLLTYDAASRTFDAASAPAWLADGYSVSITVRRK